MRLKRIEISGFKSFAKKTTLEFDAPITAIVGPNGSGKSNVAEALRWVLGEQSMKSLRGKRGEDLIFNGAGSSGRLNRASVTLVFDNEDKKLPIEFSEVIVEREVHRDGQNIYSINNSQVRLRDVIELLSAVSLGPSGHHIISQGEADRVLSANPKERREILEDALGLKIYQYKLSESEKRLEKTEENKKQVESLRREIAPHLKFLKKQVEEAEKVVLIKSELATLSKQYFVAEGNYLENIKNEISALLQNTKLELNVVESELAKAHRSPRMRELGDELSKLRIEKDKFSRLVGRLEGKIEASAHEELVRTDEKGEERCRYCGQIIIKYSQTNPQSKTPTPSANLNAWVEEKSELESKITTLISLEKEKMRELDALREEEKVSYELRAKESKFRSDLENLTLRENQYKSEKEIFARDAHEIALLTGINVLSRDGAQSTSDSREVQHDLRKKIERLKIKVEDAGGVGSDVIKEYDDTRSRDEHLTRELEDLDKSTVSLKSLMKELTETLESKFKDGLKLVNAEFNQFFATLFGGGQAKIEVVELKRPESVFIDGELLEIEGGAKSRQEAGSPDSQSEFRGIDIDVNLPRKKIKGLEMLSGGERALTSIALLFAMSQVNPPPFLVLDETDAALDEANARKYGQMLTQLSDKSQLIVVTHNRETMSHASVLYGVTMSADGISRLLSIRFDDAAQYAK
ncbi:MAG: AAA family ATPase [Patescibacteria group bacterium]